MGLRRVARECALQMLYQFDVGKAAEEEILDSFWHMNEQPEKVREFATSLVHGTISKIETIDRMIQEHAQNWRLVRMAAVDRNILRLAVFELLSDGDTPATVVINEALEIAKRFSTPDSAHFVNGILDSVHKKEIEEGRL